MYIRNQEEIARELMRHDADPNCVNDVGVFPLVIATAFGNYGMLRVLIESQKLNLRSQVKFMQHLHNFCPIKIIRQLLHGHNYYVCIVHSVYIYTYVMFYVPMIVHV